MISICVDESAVITLTEWGLWVHMNDYMAHICMIIIYITPHISVWLLTINSNQCECLAISVYVREYVLHTKLYFFFLLLELFLFYFLVVK